jgi:hypothetical protein
MDSAQHCTNQSAECRRLMKLAQSEAEAQALKNLSRTWSGLAGQIDRYNALMREQRRAAREAWASRDRPSITVAISVDF